jgi:hypothetical protein
MKNSQLAVLEEGLILGSVGTDKRRWMVGASNLSQTREGTVDTQYPDCTGGDRGSGSSISAQAQRQGYS